jgi:alpha-amylase
MYQTFEWYSPSDPHSNHCFWKEVTADLHYLKDLGVTMIWLPPACKAGNPQGNGYDIYDLWDLGEFDWKGQQPTKWGSKKELVALCAKAKELGVGTIFDAVLSHRCAADESEDMKAVKVHDKDRTKEIEKPKDITAWTKFDFPARNGMYSQLKLRREHFNATDWDHKGKERAIFKLCDEKGVPKKWTEDVDKEYGNFDYL